MVVESGILDVSRSRSKIKTQTRGEIRDNNLHYNLLEVLPAVACCED